MNPISIIHSFDGEYLSWISFPAIINKAEINMDVANISIVRCGVL